MAWFRFPLLLHRFHHFHLYHQHNNLHNERIYFYLVSLIFLFSSVLVNPMVIDVFSDNGKPIRPVSCFDAKGNKGTCMFSLACRQSKGKPIGICKDTIYAKSCCQLPGDQPKPSNGFTSNIYSTTVPKLPSSTLTTTTKTTQVLTTLTTSSSSLPSPSPPPLPSPSSLPSPSPLPSSPPTTNATQTSTTQAPITKTTPTTPTTSTSTTPSTTTAAPTTGLTNGTNLTTTGRPTVTTPVVEKESSSTSTMSPTVTLSSSPLILQESSSTIGQTIADHPSSITPLPATLPTTMISTSAKTEATLSSLPWISSSTTTHVTSSSSTTEPTTILNTETTLSTDTISTIISSSTSSSFLTDTVTETVTTEMPSSPFSTASTDFTSTSTTASSSPSTKLSTLFTEISSVSPLAISSSSQSITSTPITPATLPDSVGNLLNKILNVQRPYNNKLDCGVSPLKSMARVVGGRNAHFGEWPWQVLIKEATWLGLWMKTKCGGVLIDHRWVLTAAHCQPGFWGSLLVVVGEYDLTGDVENLKPIQKPVKRMIVHRNYNPTTFENDIALMELESPFDVQPHVVPICLPEPGEEFVGQVAHVAGWGKLSYGGPIPSILQVVKLPILANDKCQEMFNNAGHDKEIKSTFLCAGYTDGGKDSCEGDSGGPLMVQKSNGHWVLVGTVSHGIKCAEPNLPGVYMKTAAYRLWIDNIINKTVNQNNTNQTSSNNNNNISKTQLKT